MRFLKEFHRNRILPRGTNSSFIALIAKFDNPQSLDNIRPISLVGCLYKIFSKTLANKMRKVIGKVIDHFQSAFVKGRQLLHSVIVTNEVVDKAKIRKMPCLFFKVDFKKAYDCISWEFLLYMLQRLGFHQRWINWIK